MTSLKNRMGDAMRRSVVITAAVAIPILGWSPIAVAGDQVRLRVKNEGGYVIKRLEMEGGGGIVDKRLADIRLGQSGNVKYSLEPGDDINSVNVTFSVETGAGVKKKSCDSPSYSRTKNAGVITAFTLPNGQDVSDELKRNVAQIVRLTYRATGTTGSMSCKYDSYKIYDR